MAICRALAVQLADSFGADIADLHLSYSHSWASHQPGAMLAAGVVLAPCHIPVGLDLEWSHCPRRNPVELVRRAFSATESDWVSRADSEGEQQSRFLHIWTFREALGKLLGLGLADGRRRLVVSPQQPDIEFADGPAPNLHWRQFRPIPELLLTAARQADIEADQTSAWQLYSADDALDLKAADWPIAPWPDRPTDPS